MTQPKISAEAWEQAVSDFVKEAPKHLRAQSMYDSAWIKQRASGLTSAQQPAPESSGCMSCGCPISGAHYNGCVALQPGFNIHAQPAAGNDAVRTRAPDSVISAWLDRHDLRMALPGQDARCAFEDAESWSLAADQKEKT